MTIGEALKDEQKKLGLTNKQMAGDIMSQATYSKVINGKQILNSEALVQLLLQHDIDVEDFFGKLKQTYLPKRKLKEENLTKKVTYAFNTHNIEETERYVNEINQLNSNKYLMMQVNVASAFLKNKVKDLPVEYLQKVIDEITKNSNWLSDMHALRLFSNVLVVLPPANVETQMNLLFIKLKRLSNVTEKMQERYAMLCDNYLQWKYKSKLESSTDNVGKAINYLKALPDTAHMAIYRISGIYFEAVFKGNVSTGKKIKQQLLDLNVTAGVKNLPV